MGGARESGISDRLRAARARLGWTREELAFHSGVSWSAITQAESGRRRNLRPETLSRLSRALGVSVGYLVDGGPTAPMLSHQALLYSDEDDFVDGAGRFLLQGIERSEVALAMTDRRKLRLLRKRLGADADKVEFADSARGYKTPEVPLEMFTRFMTRGLGQGAVWVRIVGEPVWSGRSAAEIRLWMRYESLVNLAFAGSPMSLLCPYDVSGLDGAIVEDAHVTHPEIVERSETTRSSKYVDPARFALDD